MSSVASFATGHYGYDSAGVSAWHWKNAEIFSTRKVNYSMAQAIRAECRCGSEMPLYHFDAYGVPGMLATDSRTFPDADSARRHAVQIATSLATETDRFDDDGGAVVVDTYTAESGVVLTVRLVVGVEMRDRTLSRDRYNPTLR